MDSLKKIYNFEVSPPAEAWAHISGALDQLEQDNKIAAKLNAAELQPPAHIWSALEKELNQEDQNKKIASALHQFEVAPPKMVWDNIALNLDEQKSWGSVAALQNTEVTPPANAWHHISATLDDEAALEIIEKKLSRLKVNPPATAWLGIRDELSPKNQATTLKTTAHHGWLKYAAAACFIAIISVTAFFILRDETGGTSNNYAGNIATGNKSLPSVVTPVAVKQQPTQPPGAQQALAGIKTKLGNAYTASIEKNKEAQNRYIILMTQDGNVVRMSKKVSNMADCIAGEDHSCDDQISKWQKEMASSSTVSSPDNFLDILDMASEESAAETKL
ncbi:hypothetical protein ABDK00_004925 [Niabella insulamsoli]|uniref:hypothetical protein n=1 Tax=Niabella insulamsoli TaxID=3144874 RepID=UPI0031FC9A62